MRRTLPLFIILWILFSLGVTNAQAPTPVQGDPPNAALITISPPDEQGIVTISGASNAVFPLAQLAIRNLFTEQTVYVNANITGSFSTTIYGPGRTPFWISPSVSIPDNLRNRPVALPGGAGIIVYGNASESISTNGTNQFPSSNLTDSVISRFYVAGALAQGASIWSANGRINNNKLNAGDDFILELDMTFYLLNTTELDGLRLFAEIALQPVAIQTDSQSPAQYVAATHTNNGISNVLTPSGLAVDNLRGDYLFERIEIPPTAIVQDGNRLYIGLRFTTKLPIDLPNGVYIPMLTGYAQIGDSIPSRWEDNGIFGEGTGISTKPINRLPVVINIGDVTDIQLPFALFYDTPSDGSRGILPDESSVALSNRVKFDSPTYILPPASYPLEPYLLNQLPNSYTTNSAPLLPLLFPGGRLRASVVAPDGTVSDLPDIAIVQNRVSTAEVDERTLFGGQSPIDVYRLSTNNPDYSAFNFSQYGEYTITLLGNVEDLNGNRYTGGGTYHLLIAELMDLTPAVPSGMPFFVGDNFFPAGHIAPNFPADVTITITIYTQTGDVVTQVFEGKSNRFGYFALDGKPFTFEESGEYVIDYEARYTDANGTLWAASMRSAGVIGELSSTLIAHGGRGLDGYSTSLAPAWFNSDQLANQLGAGSLSRPHYPYFVGDVARIEDNRNSGIRPAIYVQDTKGNYEDWLLGSVPDYENAFGVNIQRMAVEDWLPLLSVVGGTQNEYGAALFSNLLVNRAYAYISAIRPDITVRQFVIGGNSPLLDLHWDSEDTYNRQFGAGTTGDRTGDYFFLYGGLVVQNAEAGINAIVPYAAFASVGGETAIAGVYPPYRGAGGGGTDGALLTYGDDDHDIFIHLTGIRPYEVVTEGEMLTIAGQIAPTLTSRVDVVVTSPSGEKTNYSATSNPLGYFYHPEYDQELDEIGIWTVEIVVTPTDTTSAGALQNPVPTGSALGAINKSFSVYVTDSEAPVLEWSRPEGKIAVSAGAPLNFSVTAPNTWSGLRGYVVVSTASNILQAESLTMTGRTASYQYNPTTLNATFPNIETDGRGSGAWASDVVRMTFIITGTDGEGNPNLIARTTTLFHDTLYSVDTESLGE